MYTNGNLGRELILEGSHIKEIINFINNLKIVLKDLKESNWDRQIFVK